MSNIIIDVVRSDSANVDAQLLLGLKGDTGDSAYEYAVAHGYDGTEYEYGELMASYATVAEDAAESASEAAGSASDASDSATDAASSASAAAASATEASGYASNALASDSAASGSATSAEQSAIVAAASASSAASASNSASQSANSATASATSAAGSAESASVSAGDAETSAQSASQSAEDAASAAQTAEDARDTILGMTIVTDVEINGTSIVADGVADIPVAESNKYGTVKAGLSSVGADSYSAVSLSFKNNGTLKTYTLAQSGVASTTKRGLMSASDKTKLSHIAEGAEVNVQADWNVSNASSDAYIKNKPTLFSGDYNDLENKPDIPSKTSDLDNDVPFVELADLSDLLPTDTASGSIASFPDGQSVIPAVSVKADIEPIQDLHGYDKPWSGGAGKNKFDGAIESGALDPSNGQKIANSERYRSANFIKVQPNTAYALSVNGTLQSANIYSYGSDKSFLSDVARPYANTFTTSADTHYVMFFGTSALNSDRVQLESGSTASAWTPYSNICPISGRTECDTYVSPTTSETDAEVYTTTLGRTVYGGTLDVVSGVLTVTHAMVDLGDIGWGYNPSYGFITTALSGVIKNAPSYVTKANIVCSIYETGTYNDITGAIVNNQIGVSGGNYGYVVARDTRFTDATAFETAMSGVQLCYELATPQTYQLTPTEVALLKGQNNVWTDSGEVEVTYKADIGKYVDKKITELQALVLEQ